MREKETRRSSPWRIIYQGSNLASLLWVWINWSMPVCSRKVTAEVRIPSFCIPKRILLYISRGGNIRARWPDGSEPQFHWHLELVWPRTFVLPPSLEGKRFHRALEEVRHHFPHMRKKRENDRYLDVVIGVCVAYKASEGRTLPVNKNGNQLPCGVIHFCPGAPCTYLPCAFSLSWWKIYIPVEKKTPCEEYLRLGLGIDFNNRIKITDFIALK